uniref:Uncharacterized protein n=1 Tax=Romanomermis culicivorax TaxID=13658 RepID=A0A915K361_ROMCU
MTKNRFAREFDDLKDYIDDDVEDNSLEEDQRLIPICKFRGHAFCKLHRVTRPSAPKQRNRQRSVSQTFHNDDRKNDFCQCFCFNNCASCCLCCPFRLRSPIVVDDFINFYDRRKFQDDICRLSFDRRGCDYSCCGYSIPFKPCRPRNRARPEKGRKGEIRKNHSSSDDIDPLATCLVNRTSKLFKEAVKEWENQEDDENDFGFDRSRGTDEKVERRPTNGVLKKSIWVQYERRVHGCNTGQVGEMTARPTSLKEKSKTGFRTVTDGTGRYLHGISERRKMFTQRV